MKTDLGEIVYWAIVIVDLAFLVSVVRLEWLPISIAGPISFGLVFIALFIAGKVHSHQTVREKKTT